jgi:beta-aspartyl-peptidase (threonine type)
MRRRFVLLVPLALSAGCASPPAFDACRRVLDDQAAAWNRGDLDGFVQSYARGERTVFAGTDAVHLGFDAMLARYRTSYPTREAMGVLGFSDLVFLELGPEHVLVRGRWRLVRTADRPAGSFALVLRRLPEGWRIVLDYTTSDTPSG